MNLGRVIGRVIATARDPLLAAHRLLLVQPIHKGGEPLGVPLVMLDAVGAGSGQVIFYARGKEAAMPFQPAPPTDATVTGIVDRDAVDGTHHPGVTP